MTEAEWIAGRLVPSRPLVEGTPRFWGEWFGKPYDEIYRVVKCEAEGELLKLYFDHEEILSVSAPRRAGFLERLHPMAPGEYSPSGRVIRERVFRIGGADRVRWEWFYYDSAHPAKNNHFLDYCRTDAGIRKTTDRHDPAMVSDPEQPAVELILMF
jgi:hypothetical protein